MAQVDVFIPCYRYGRYLRRCVESVLAQEGVSVRVLIVDDASDDETPQVGKSLAQSDGRVQYHRNPINVGHIGSYNIGIQWCDSDYNLLLSADDLLAPGALARAAQLMDADPTVGLTYGRQVIYIGDGPLPDLPLDATLSWTVVSGKDFIETSCDTSHNVVPTPTAVVRTSIQKQIGGYRKELPHSGDLEMWLRFAAHGNVGAIDAYQAYYRVHTDNMYKSYPGAKDHWQRKAAFDTFFAEHGHCLEGKSRLQSLCNQRLGETAFWSAHNAWAAGDVAACRELLDAALQAWPHVEFTRAWTRFRWKRVFGPLSRVLEPALDRVRHRLRATPQMDGSGQLKTPRGWRQLHT